MTSKRFDDRRAGGLCLDSLTDFRQTPGERCFTHKRLWPAVLQQFFFGDYTVAMLQEVDEHCKNFRFNGDLLAGTA